MNNLFFMHLLMICQGLRHDQILIAAGVNSKKLELIEMFWLQECRYRYNRPLNYIPLRVQNREITSGWQSARAWGRRSWQSTSTELLWLETSMMRLKFSQKNLYLTLNLSSRNFRILMKVETTTLSPISHKLHICRGPQMYAVKLELEYCRKI